MSSSQRWSESPRLSYDVLLEIIQYLDPIHDIDALRSLSTTCHALCVPCQRHLLSSITIWKPPVKHSSVPHGHCLLKSPHLASYIKHLDYKFNFGDEKFLETVLIMLPVDTIEVLKISTHSRIEYHSCGRVLTRELIRIFRSSSLRRLQLHGLTGIPRFTTDIPSLTTLFVETVPLKEIGEDIQPVTLGLKSLTVAWRFKYVSYQLKSVLKCSPLLQNIRCYGNYPVLINDAGIMAT